MNPRLKTSKKWTELPKEYTSQVEEVFQQGFAAHLKDSKLVIEGRIYPEEILLRVGVLEKGRLAQANFEVSMGYGKKNKDVVDRMHDGIDAIASMMADYFENEGEVELPRTWQEYDFNDSKLHLQFTTENSDLEAKANELLGLDGEEDLIQEEAESEDALARAEIIASEKNDDDSSEANESEDELEDEEISGPTMFGGKKKKEDLH